MEGKIPLAIGFANLMGSGAHAMLREDVAALSPLFRDTIVAPDWKIPTTSVLFIYERLNEDGSISGAGPVGVRQIVQLTKAQTVVVASQNTDASILKAMSFPGPKTANLIFTYNRNGAAFAKFFCRLFEYMRDGYEMLAVWAVLAPQGPVRTGDLPGLILLAEAGKLVFPQTTDA
jgi:hypothetical protein